MGKITFSFITHYQRRNKHWIIKIKLLCGFPVFSFELSHFKSNKHILFELYKGKTSKEQNKQTTNIDS